MYLYIKLIHGFIMFSFNFKFSAVFKEFIVHCYRQTDVLDLNLSLINIIKELLDMFILSLLKIKLLIIKIAETY